MDLAYKQGVGTLDGAGKGRGGSTGMQARAPVGYCTEKRGQRGVDKGEENEEVRGRRIALSFSSH